jgi:hypothetical protein
MIPALQHPVSPASYSLDVRPDREQLAAVAEQARTSGVASTAVFRASVTAATFVKRTGLAAASRCCTTNLLPTTSTLPRTTTPMNPELMARYRADLAAVRAAQVARRSPLENAWGDLLRDLPWQWHASLIVPKRVPIEQIPQRWQRWIDAVESHRERQSALPVIWVYGLERAQRTTVRALLAGVAGVSRFHAIRAWNQLGGGWAHVTDYDPALGGHYRLAKSEVRLSDAWFRNVLRSP